MNKTNIEVMKDGAMWIAGPCSAESEEQVMGVARGLKEMGVDVFRAGVWKPRTDPRSFQGMGEKALPWLRRVKEEMGMEIATEVATAQHVELALKYGVNVLWIGARTSGDPFAVQEIAEAMRGWKGRVMVKNPMNEDVGLWIGALERLKAVGIERIDAIHRGFYRGEGGRYRNEPLWHVALELRRRIDGVGMICDPSHMGGRRELIEPLSLKAMDLGYDGLMIEVHENAKMALSDKEQQIGLKDIRRIMEKVETRRERREECWLDGLRMEIEAIDEGILRGLGRRMEIVERIGEGKRRRGMEVMQRERFEELVERHMERGRELGLEDEFVRKVWEVVHEEAVRRQGKK